MLMHADKKRAQGRRREEGRAGEQQTKAVTLVSKQHWLCADASEYCWLVTVKILFSLTIWGRLVIAPGRLLSRLLEHPYRPSHPTHVSLHAKLLCSLSHELTRVNFACPGLQRARSLYISVGVIYPAKDQPQEDCTVEIFFCHTTQWMMYRSPTHTNRQWKCDRSSDQSAGDKNSVTLHDRGLNW